MQNYLEFEKPLAEIEGKAEELRAMGRANSEMDVEKEAKALDKKAQQMLRDLYKDLSPWRKCQVARHPDRPHCSDYIKELFTEYTPLAGDRNFADDLSVMGGLARLDGRPVMVIGHEKGVETAAFQGRDELLVMREIEVRVGVGAGVAPCRGVDTDGAHERAEVHLASGVHVTCLVEA